MSHFPEIITKRYGGHKNTHSYSLFKLSYTVLGGVKFSAITCLGTTNDIFSGFAQVHFQAYSEKEEETQ